MLMKIISILLILSESLLEDNHVEQ